ncbi:MAG TPA: DUF1858 domain-containing protein [Thermoanaerobaculia bacterium]|nr:DUF1858 domain-containing protein [Thermoanaerobaculia bacterium]
MNARIELISNLEELLRDRPALVTFFLARRMACPGCPMARFETLADAARNYHISPEELLAEVRLAAGSAG